MFDKLIDLVVEFLGLFQPFTVVNPCQAGIAVRSLPFSKQRIRELGPGFHWIMPFKAEQVYTLSMSTRVDELAAQTLVTQDGRNIIIGVVVTYRVHNVETALNSVYEPFAAVQDAVQANVADMVITADYATIPTPKFSDDLTALCRKRGFKYGFEIDSVRLAEFAPTRTYRLMGDGAL